MDFVAILSGAGSNLPDDDRIRRILVLKWSAMGDVVIASAGFESIYRAFPGREIHLHTFPPWDALFRDDPRFSKVLTIDLRRRDRGLTGIARWVREVKRNRYDVIFDMQSNDRSWLLMCALWLSGSRPRYLVGTHRRFPYHLAPPQPVPSPTHPVEQMRAALQAAGVRLTVEHPVLYPAERHRAQAAALLAEHQVDTSSYAVLLPGSQLTGSLKRWGAQRYSMLAEALHAQGVTSLVLVGGPDDLDECRRVEQGAGPWLVNLCDKTQLLDLVAIIEGSKLVVANDTGPAHIASATLRPMVMICGPTDPARVKPRGEHVVALQASVPCINCYRTRCAHHSCMRLIKPEHVVAKLRDLSAL